MIWFQILAILVLVALVAFFVVSRGTARASAGVKILFVGFVVFGVYAMLRQDDVTWVANKLGIQRGLDLVLFLLVIAFAFTTISTYLRFRELEIRYARLARAVALQNAEAAADPPTAPHPPIE